ncbi:hypothetical protein NIES2100_29920 [Calothrix sp. NIES-2100]|uniref:hypothetical protein n=1 Tax=Calothrix sp. NIES-2100 TaxID=1954172 RepID=UPI000B616B00|nr:hypothetical protein NIES2100_29920 [Calothrix sp. NIES-2100]
MATTFGFYAVIWGLIARRGLVIGGYDLGWGLSTLGSMRSLEYLLYCRWQSDEVNRSHCVG